MRVSLDTARGEAYMHHPAMDRLSFSLTEQQMAWLRRQARQLGITIGELLRRLIDKERLGK